ncbi:MAG TPA: type II toxin-antitoxin system prevent-host-death family antitoxin [Vicinamibacterales bacterium]|jgi:prevent-host-death family protein
MKAVNVHEAKTHLSRLLEQVEAGEEIILARNGKAVARLVPFRRLARRPGGMKGQIRLSRNFDAPLPKAVKRAFLGESE